MPDDVTPDVAALMARVRRIAPATGTLAQLADLCERQAAENAALRLELEGEKKANALLNAGMGEVCEGRDAMKHELRTLRAQVAELTEGLRPFAQGHLYADEELRHLPDIDAQAINPYDTSRGPTVGDCRRAAALLEKPT